MPLFYLMGEVDDAPGIIVLGMNMIFISMVVAAFAFILEHLLKDVILEKKVEYSIVRTLNNCGIIKNIFM